ncbi:MAG TPA: PEGA domain-containing protein [Caldithrix abyssi]|uniref:PEGA domain-containing protein n=1 Tax=Caldithrix abyssi TaxID=187145 RepID=A0A7V5PP47_CALAY|nr:PEGA domain-containing protein [Caldithrix abyssi]
MKKLTILVFLLGLSIHLYAQLAKMSIVGKPEKSESEIIGRRDVNGRFCAAIKVLSDMEGFTYDAYNGVVGDVEHQAGMDIVYLQPDERVLQIFHTGYEPLKIILSEVGIRLKPKEMWVIRIKGAPKKADMLPVSIVVKPQDASVFIDGKDAGKGPTYNLTPGKHQLRITKAHYKSVAREITVDEKHVLFNFTLEEQEDIPVQIEGEPSGATVYIDGLEFGTTPLAGFYPPGQYTLRIEKKGYLPLEEKIRIAEPAFRKNYRLQENVGFLTINTDPKAKVYINDKLVTGRKRIKLPPMIARVKVVLPKADVLEKQVAIKKDETLTLDMYPKVPTGTVRVAVVPFDAKVELKGDAGEYFSATGLKVFKNIPIGRYQLIVSRNGYQQASETFTLTQGQKLSKTIKLKKPSPGASKTAAAVSGAKKAPAKAEPAGDMVLIHGGTFQMGDVFNEGFAAEKPVHSVTVNDFYMGVHEVTQKEWTAIMGFNPSKYKDPNSPVEWISWFDAVEFCNLKSKKEGLTPCYTFSGPDVICNFDANGYRLPTEAEWEYAAREGGRRVRFGNGQDVADPAQINFNGNANSTAKYFKPGDYRRMPWPVGSFKPNALGLYDMSGNVWEWCWDWYSDNYYQKGESDNPRGPKTGNFKAIRGGSFSDGPEDIRCTNRIYSKPSLKSNGIGFRLVRTR